MNKVKTELHHINLRNISFAKSFTLGDNVRAVNNSLKIGKVEFVELQASCPQGFKGWLKIKWSNNTSSWVLANNIERVKHTKAEKKCTCLSA